MSTKMVCVEPSGRKFQISYVGSSTNDKSGIGIHAHEICQSGYSLTYIPGDEIQFSCFSGEMSTILHDHPLASKEYQIDFYAFVVIGNQTWMAENLAWLSVVSPSGDGSSTLPYYYVYGYEDSSVDETKSSSNYSTYGVFYNWEAAKTACPIRWHLPSEDEWKILEVYLGMTESDADSIEWRKTESTGYSIMELHQPGNNQ